MKTAIKGLTAKNNSFKKTNVLDLVGTSLKVQERWSFYTGSSNAVRPSTMPPRRGQGAPIGLARRHHWMHHDLSGQDRQFYIRLCNTCHHLKNNNIDPVTCAKKHLKKKVPGTLGQLGRCPVFSRQISAFLHILTHQQHQQDPCSIPIFEERPWALGRTSDMPRCPAMQLGHGNLEFFHMQFWDFCHPRMENTWKNVIFAFWVCDECTFCQSDKKCTSHLLTNMWLWNMKSPIGKFGMI